MNCPSEEKILELLDGDLPAPEESELLTHIKSCKSCMKMFSEHRFIQAGIVKLLADKKCFSEKDLLAYHEGTLPEEQQSAVKAHLEECLSCRALLSDLSLAEKTADDYFANIPAWEEKAWKAAMQMMKEFAREGLAHYGRLWQKVCELVTQREKASDWNLAWVESNVSGTLGAAEADPQAIMAMMTMLVAALISRDLEDGSVPRDPKRIAEKAVDYARKIGAEKGLTDHIQKVLPNLLLES
jgi:anti-sigma factor RsiW